MNYLIYCSAFLFITIMLLFGLYNKDFELLRTAGSLLFFIVMSFIGTTISQLKKKNIDLKRLKIFIPLFLISISLLIYFISIDLIIVGACLSFLIGVISCIYLLKTSSQLSDK